MYIEQKSDDERCFDDGPARIGLVTFSKTGKTVYYNGKSYARSSGSNSNHFEEETGHRYWITGPKKNGLNRNYSNRSIEIDENVREQYWAEIRKQPEHRHKSTTRAGV